MRLPLQWLGLSMAETRLNVRQYEQNLPDTVYKDVILITQRSLAKAALRPARGGGISLLHNYIHVLEKSLLTKSSHCSTYTVYRNLSDWWRSMLVFVGLRNDFVKYILCGFYVSFFLLLYTYYS